MRLKPRSKTEQTLLHQVGAIAKYACPRHKVEYVVPGGDDVECPVCLHEGIAEDLRISLQMANGKIELLEKEIVHLRGKVDSAFAMGNSMDLLDVHDRTFLKSVLYRWREDKAVTLKITHRYDDDGKKADANGFIAVYRRGDPVGHQCTSIGGVALSGYYEETQRQHGDATAMQLLARAANDLLRGGVT